MRTVAAILDPLQLHIRQRRLELRCVFWLQDFVLPAPQNECGLLYVGDLAADAVAPAAHEGDVGVGPTGHVGVQAADTHGVWGGEAGVVVRHLVSGLQQTTQRQYSKSQPKQQPMRMASS